MFATFDEMFQGRTLLCIGAGGAINSRPIRIQWPSNVERVQRLREATEIIRMIWASGGKRIRYGGQSFRLNQMKLYTMPQNRIPIYIAAAGENTARIAGKYGDGLVTTGDPLKPRTKDLYNIALQEARR